MDQITAIPKHIVVRAEWDDEARMWVGSTDDLPGVVLVTEAPSIEALRGKLRLMIPDALDLPPGTSSDVPLDIIAHVSERVPLVA